MAGARRLMADFLLELLSEEIPARMQATARNNLARLFAECTGEAGLKSGPIDVYSTPRRLALIAREVAEATEASREEVKGPRASAPPQALEGFLRKTGLTKDQLEERDGVYFALIERAGRPASEILSDTVRRIVADFPWPKSMRWGDGDLRWVRPLHGIVAMLGEDIVPVEIAGTASGATTVGHRFHHPGDITIGGASDYVEKLRACHVIVDQEERERIVRDGAAAAAKEAGLTLLADEGLVVENAGLTEWPVPLVGRFDPEFLDVPREVIVLTMRTNQKYFACTNDEGLLAPAFVCVANIAANDGGEAIAKAIRGCSRRGWRTPASSGSRTSRFPSRSRRRSSTASCSTRSLAPSPTRSSASPSSLVGWSRAAWLPPHTVIPAKAGIPLLAKTAGPPLPRGWRKRNWRTRRNAPRGWRRRTLSPVWSASSPSSRA